MTLVERIALDMTAAMKAREELRLSTLRMVKTALKMKEVDKRQPLTDAEAMQVLVTQIKQREDAAQQFQDGGRAELAAKERAEIVIINAYLPQLATPEQVEAAVSAALAQTGATGPKAMGAVMKATLTHLQATGARADGKLVSETVKRRLGAGA